MKYSLLLYTAIIRPLLTYACLLWAAASRTKIKKLQTLQKQISENVTKSRPLVHGE